MNPRFSLDVHCPADLRIQIDNGEIKVNEHAEHQNVQNHAWAENECGFQNIKDVVQNEMRKHPGITPQEMEVFLQDNFKDEEIPRKQQLKRWMSEHRSKMLGSMREPSDICLSTSTLRKTPLGRRYITQRRTQNIIEGIMVFQSTFMSHAA